MLIKNAFIYLLLLFTLTKISAQELYFREFKPDISNSPEHIYKILQDKNGFIWLGTEKGLLQFDGINYTYFNTPKSNTITSLFQDDSAKIWQGYKDGHISYLHNGKNTDFKPKEGLPKVAINAILEDKDKRIWFATYGEGVYYWEKNRLYNINTVNGLTDNYTYDLAINNSGNIYVATDRGITKIHISNGKKMLQQINQNNGLPDNLVTSLNLENDLLNIGTQSGGFCIYDIKKENIIINKSNWEFGQINTQKYQAQTGLLIGTNTHGLLQIDRKTGEILHHYNRENLFGISKITDQFNDKNGNSWIAGGTQNVCFANSDFSIINLNDFPEIKSIRAIKSLGNIYWLGTGNGIFIYDKLTKKIRRTQFPALNTANVTSFELIDSKLIIGTLGQGIYIYQTSEKWFKHFTEKEGLVNDNVLSITSKNNKIYIATLGGISIAALENSNINFQNLSRKNGFPADYIYQVYAEGNNIWFGTDGKGLIKYTDGKFVVYNAENGLPARSVISITGSENDLWIGTSDDGFYRFDGKKFTKYQNNSKQKDYNIRSIVQISKNKLIIVHENGLDVINPQNNSVQTLREELGLQNTDPELNVWSRQDFDDYAGDYIFALGNKIVHYFDIENENINQPETRIKNVSLFLNPIPVNTTRFNHDENHISFDFIGLWYHHPEQVIYQVKLEGYDLDWVNTRDHFITYPSLPPGKYRFRVRSSATDNFENASEATYSFIVAKPFWKQAWFFIPLIVLFGTGIFFYMRYREKMLQKKANIARQNIEFQYETLRSQVNPHFLFNSFNTLAGVIETDQKMAVEYVEQLSDFFRNLLVYKDKDVITLQEELQLLENYFFLQKKRYSNNLQLQLNIGEKYKTFLLPPLCLQLLIENAIKHNIVSKDKPLNILVETGENILRVQNHFQPKAYMEKSTGIGLANIKNRYSILTKEQVKIVQDELFFTVEIPLLKP